MSHEKYKHVGDPFDCLIEECSELIKALVKARRFGLDNFNPYDPSKISNRDSILSEIEDVKKRIIQVQGVINEKN